MDYGTLDDLRPKDRDLYMRNVLPLTHPGGRFLLYCFEWPARWWERPFSSRMALEPGEAERRFGEHFQIERIAGETSPRYWLSAYYFISEKHKPPGFAVYLMTRKPT